MSDELGGMDFPEVSPEMQAVMQWATKANQGMTATMIQMGPALQAAKSVPEAKAVMARLLRKVADEVEAGKYD